MTQSILATPASENNMGFVPDLNQEHYKRAIEGKKVEIERLANNILAHLSSAKDPNSRRQFSEACAQLRKSIGEMQVLFSPNTPVVSLGTMDNVIQNLERRPDQPQLISQFVDLMHRVPNIPDDRPALEDEVKKLVDEKELQEKIDELEGKLTQLIEKHGNEIHYKVTTELQRFGDVLLKARKRSLLEVLAASSGVITLAGAAVDIHYGTPVGTVLAGIVQTAMDIRSSASEKFHTQLVSYLDELNVHMPPGQPILDNSATPSLTIEP